MLRNTQFSNNNMKNIQLLIGPDRLKVDSKELSSITISYSLKDIKNYGQRNSSFTKPISVLQTKNTDRIFRSLFNINSYGGYDVGIKVYAELVEDGITILKGNLQVMDITVDTYEVVLVSNNISLFNDLGDRLLSGNINSDDDLSWSGTPYQHTYSRDLIRTMNNVEPSTAGVGYCYPVIDYSGDIAWPYGISFNNMYPNALIDDYKILPAIAAKQIFDRLFEVNGYTYEMSSDIQTPLERLWIPFNDDYLNHTSDYWLYGKYYLGNARDLSYPSTSILLSTYTINSWFTSEIDPVFSIRGFTFYDTYLPLSYNRVSGGYDNMHEYSSTYKITDTGFPLPHAGSFIIDVSMAFFNSDAGSEGDTEWSISTWNEIDGNITTPIGSATIPAASNGFINESITVSVSQKSRFRIHRSTTSSTLINLLFGQGTYIEIGEVNSLIGAAPVFDLNNMLPKSYRQSDFVNDIFKMFNAYVSVDTIDENKIYIRSFNDYYSGGTRYDWSKKIDTPSIKFKPIKNSFAKNTYLKLTDDADIYTQDYLAKYPQGIYTKKVVNDTDFGAADNIIQLSVGPGNVIRWPDTDNFAWFGYTSDPSMNLLQINDGKQFKTSWKPKLLFANTYDASIKYGSDASSGIDPWFRKISTLTPRMLKEKDVSNNVFIGFDSVNTYISELTESNENLYNKYYKEDLESNLSDYSYLLEAKFHLNANDINEVSFDDLIWIENSKIGSGWYKLNAIKDYVPGAGQLTTVELLKQNIIDATYNSEIGANVIYKSITAEGGVSGAGGTSPGGGTSGGAGTLQETLENGNITTEEIIFQNSGTPASQVALQVDTNSQLTIDGVAVNDMFIEEVSPIENQILFSTNTGNASTNEQLFVTSSVLNVNKANLFLGSVANDQAALLTSNQNSDNSNKNLFIYPGNDDVNAADLKLYSVYGGNVEISSTGGLINIIGDTSISSGDLYLKDGIVNDAILFSGADGKVEKSSSLTFDGNTLEVPDISVGSELFVNNLLGKDPFFSGFLGSGERFYKDPDGYYTGELDNLIVRRAAHFYELIIDKIRATNGSIVVSDTAPAVWSGTGDDYIPAGIWWESTGAKQYQWYFYTSPSENGLAINDLIKAQQFKGNGTAVYEYVVRDLSDANDKVYVSSFGTERSDSGGPGTSDNMSSHNVNMNVFGNAATGPPYSGYDWSGSNNQYFQTNTFQVRGKGKVSIGGFWTAAASGTISMQVFDWTGTAISTFQYFNLISGYNLGYDTSILYDLGESGRDTDPSCYIRVKVTAAGGATADNFAITSIKDKTLSTANSENQVDGFDFVRWGNLTDTDRQGLVYLTASDSGAPFIQILAGMNTFTISAANQKGRFGNLEGIVDSYVGGALSGYGIYTDNGYFKGTIWAADGSIAGWTIDSSSIYTGAEKLTDGYSTSGMTLASDGGIHAQNAYINANGDCAFRQIEEAVFKVDGDAYGLKLSGSEIWENDYNGQSWVLVNYRGYQGGTTQYRRFVVGNGKGSGNIWYVNANPADGGYGINHWIETFFNDAVIFNVDDFTASHTITQDENAVFNYNSASVSIFTLPPSPYDGQIVFVRNRYKSPVKNLTVASGTAGSIDGATGAVASITLASGSSGIFMWNDNSTMWQIMGAYSVAQDGNSW